MNILIIGSGGREHAFSWKIKQSPLCSNLYVAPGNAGTSMLAENVNMGVDEFEKIKKLCLDKKIDLVIIGPEVPLVGGLRDHLEAEPSLNKIRFIFPWLAESREA